MCDYRKIDQQNFKCHLACLRANGVIHEICFYESIINGLTTFSESGDDQRKIKYEPDIQVLLLFFFSLTLHQIDFFFLRLGTRG